MNFGVFFFLWGILGVFFFFTILDKSSWESICWESRGRESTGLGLPDLGPENPSPGSLEAGSLEAGSLQSLGYQIWELEMHSPGWESVEGTWAFYGAAQSFPFLQEAYAYLAPKMAMPPPPQVWFFIFPLIFIGIFGVFLPT